MDKFNILPAEIATDILTRVPAKSVLDCKSVSKTWKNLIQHSSFSKMHTNFHSHYGDSGQLSFLALAMNYEQLYYFEYVENHETPLGRIREISLIPPFKCDTLVGSVNGLLCLKGRRFFICNPITKESVILPEYKVCNYKCGFGYLPRTEEYKVVLVCYEDSSIVHIMVYTLGSGNGWRNLGEYNLQFDNANYRPGVFAYGALHWRDGLGKKIYVFDLADEKFRKYLSPPDARWYEEFGVMGGFLYWAKPYFEKVFNHPCFDIWIHKMKNANSDTKGHQSMDWSREFTLASQNSIPIAYKHWWYLVLQWLLS